MPPNSGRGARDAARPRRSGAAALIAQGGRRSTSTVEAACTELPDAGVEHPVMTPLRHRSRRTGHEPEHDARGRERRRQPKLASAVERHQDHLCRSGDVTVERGLDAFGRHDAGQRQPEPQPVRHRWLHRASPPLAHRQPIGVERPQPRPPPRYRSTCVIAFHTSGASRSNRYRRSDSICVGAMCEERARAADMHLTRAHLTPPAAILRPGGARAPTADREVNEHHLRPQPGTRQHVPRQHLHYPGPPNRQAACTRTTRSPRRVAGHAFRRSGCRSWSGLLRPATPRAA